MIKVISFEDCNLEGIQHVDYHMSHDQLDDLCSSLISALEFLEQVQQEEKISFKDIYVVIRLGYLREKYNSHVDKKLVRTGVVIQTLGVMVIRENLKMEVCNEDNIPYHEFEGIN